MITFATYQGRRPGMVGTYLDILKTSFPPESISNYVNSFIDRIDQLHIIIKHNGKPVGLCALHETKKGGAHVAWVAIIPEYRGKGYGKRLMQFVFDVLPYGMLERTQLYCRVDNTQGIYFWGSMGFILSGDTVTLSTGAKAYKMYRRRL